MNSFTISIAHDAVKAFIKRFNNRSVFTDINVNCPDILIPRSETGTKIIAITKIKYEDRDGRINIDSDEFYKIGYGDLIMLLKLCYIAFSLGINEKHQSQAFDYVTKVYKEIITLLSDFK